MIDRYEQFCSSISVIYKGIQKIKRDEMARCGLKGPHAQCLIVLNRREEGATISQLCDACELDKAAVSRVVAELQEKGLVGRESPAEKHYRTPLCLTTEGREIAVHISTIAEAAVEAAGGGLEDEERQTFYRVLGQIAANVQRISREGLPCENSKGSLKNEQ